VGEDGGRRVKRCGRGVRDDRLTDVVFCYVLIVLECAFTEFAVIFIIPFQSFSQEIKAMKMMQAFDVGGIATAVLGVDANLV
jgi:hypothetical protein